LWVWLSAGSVARRGGLSKHISVVGGITMTNNELKQHVQSALDWEPSVDATDIGVSVDEGVVTLRGNVGSHMEKQMAERIILRV
jgi:osmotically-inducible protein OsmY